MSPRLIVFTQILLLAIFTTVIKADDGLSLSGEVKSIRFVDEDAHSIRLEVTLDMTLKNLSKSNIILYGSDFYEISLNLYIVNERKNVDYLHMSGQRPGKSFMRKERNKLDRPNPPPKLTTIIKPGSLHTFEKKMGLTFSKVKRTGTSEGYWGEIVRSSPLWMKISLMMFPTWLDYLNSEPTFGKELQKRWAKTGYLWIDDISSDPIPLDLSEINRAHPGTN